MPDNQRKGGKMACQSAKLKLDFEARLKNLQKLAQKKSLDVRLSDDKTKILWLNHAGQIICSEPVSVLLE